MKSFLNSTHQAINNKRKGFAITFEIMMAGLLATVGILIVVYLVELLNTQRFMYDLTASTCTAAARYGGDESRAYQFQVRQNNPNGTAYVPKSISDNANKYIKAIAAREDVTTKQKSFVFDGAGEDGKYITVSSEPENGYVWVELSFRYGQHGFGNILNMLSISDADNPTPLIQYRVYLPTLMQSGELL